MTTLSTLAIVAALFAGGTSLAMAQNGPATGGESPVAGGAAGNPAWGSENTASVPGTGPAYIAQPGYVGTAAPRVHRVHHRSTYMYVPPQRTHKVTHNTSL